MAIVAVRMDQTREFAERRWLALGLLCTAQFMVVLDASIVNVALPSIGEALQFSQENLSWVVNAYVLTFGGFLLLGGRMADLLGRRRVFMSGLVLFALASLAGGFAESEGVLIAARAVQGLGAAIVSPAALSIVTTTFRDGAERNKALGVWGAVAGSGGAAGVLLGGVLTDGLGWEWVLWVNVPIGIVAALLAPRLIAESRSEARTRSFDVAGAFSVTAGLSLLVYALVDATDAGWGSAQTIVLLAIAVALLAAFVAIELRSEAPLVPFRIFRIRTLTGANIVGLLIGASLFSMFFFISLYMQQVLGYSAIKAGLSYLPLALAIILSAGIGSALVDEARLQAGARGRHGVHRGRAALVRPGLHRRRLPERHPRSVAARGDRPRARVRDQHDRRGVGGGLRGGGPRQRADQHVAAGRRRARPGDPRDDRQLAHRGRARKRRFRGHGRRAHGGLPGGLHGRRGVRHRRPDRDARADPRVRQPGARGARQRQRAFYSALTSASTFATDSLASPNSSAVFSL